MTDDTARIGNTVQAMATASESMRNTSRGRSFVAGAPNGESCKNTQFIKDVSVHTFPNENIQSTHIFIGLDLFGFVRHNRPLGLKGHLSK